MHEYRYASLTELGAALRRRRVTAPELAAAAIHGLDTVGRQFNAVATLLPPRASLEARRAQRVLDGGAAASPLLGIPYAVKDLFAARGGPTTWGSAVYRSRVINADAAAVARLRRRGAVLVAKLAMSEFAGGGRPRVPGASMHGSGRNPWDRSRYSGGSSSGSGIAVALGLVPYALGTETGGSIVGPAAFSGVTGLRPTPGLVPVDGAMTLSWSLDKVGPLARYADDCAFVLEALSRHAAARRITAAEMDRLLPGLRVAWLDTELDEAAPNIRAALARGIATMRRLGPRFVGTGIDRAKPYIEPLELITNVEGGFEHRGLLLDPSFRMTDERQQSALRGGLDVPASAYLEALRDATWGARAAFDAVFSEVDLILSASRATIAPSLSEARPPRDAAKMSDLLRAAANLAGVPGVSFPCGLSDDQMPVGLHLLGRPGSDQLLLGVAAAFQRISDDHLRRPPDPPPDRPVAG